MWAAVDKPRSRYNPSLSLHHALQEHKKNFGSLPFGCHHAHPNMLHFSCLASRRRWAPPEAATIPNLSTAPCLACWAHLVLFHWKCHISALLKEKGGSSTISRNSEAWEQQEKAEDAAVCLLKTLHYKIKVLKQKVPHPAATPLGTTPRGSLAWEQFSYTTLHSAKLGTVCVLRREHRISVGFEFPCFCQPHYYSSNVIKMLLFVC